MADSIEIDKLIMDLNADYSADIPIPVQEEAIEKLAVLVDDESLYKLVLPHHKGYWENSARVLKKIGFPRVLIIADLLMRWLQDMNWPGARTIFNMLLEGDDEIIIPVIERALMSADKENDSVWIYWLTMLAEEKGIREIMGDHLKMIMEKGDE